jgi:hypothetical protein
VREVLECNRALWRRLADEGAARWRLVDRGGSSSTAGEGGTVREVLCGGAWVVEVQHGGG